MSVTSGFYPSLNGDRKYSAADFASIYSGVINDGVFASIGTCFVAKVGSNNLINIGIGRAWLNNSYIENDSVLPVSCSEPNLLYDRIDAIVIEINSSDLVRGNSIKFIEGVAASTPTTPTLQKSINVNQYPICYIYRRANSTSIAQADITNKVGSADLKFVTAILEVISIEELMGQWESQLDNFVDQEENDIDEFMTQMQNNFTAWFNTIQGQIDDDLGISLVNRLNSLQHIQSIKYPSTNWTSSAPYKNTVSVSGATVNGTPDITFSLVSLTDQTNANRNDYVVQANKIWKFEMGNGVITAIAVIDKPTRDIWVDFKGVS